MLAALLALHACSAIDGEEACEALEPVPVNLSLGVGGPVQTKADATVITEMESTFRGMTGVRILPFYTGIGVKVAPGDRAKGWALSLPDILGGSYDSQVYDGLHFHEGLLETSQAHLYSSSDANMPVGVTAALVYGQGIPVAAATERAGKSLNGSLLEEGWEAQEASHSSSDIFFSPDPLYDADASAAAWQVADLLTQLSSVTYDIGYYYYYNEHYEHVPTFSLPWSGNLSDTTLKGAFEDFVAGGALFPGDGRLLENRLNALRSRLESYASTDTSPLLHTPGDYPALHEEGGSAITWGELYNGLRDALLAKLDQLETASYKQFPVSAGLPAGAALFRWNGARIVPVPDDTGALLAAMDFCYMPPLYYFTNTILRTSTNSYIYEQFPQKTWEQILRMYTAGYIVTYESRSVALESPLQFACGMLKVTLRSSTPYLQDNDGDPETRLTISSGTEFPLTGLVLGGQFRQRFDFTPVMETDMSTVFREYFLYDSHISEVYLKTETSPVFRTLSLPTPKERDIYFALEFRNDSGRDFYGADGLVPKGCTFYLLGKLDPPPSESGLERALIADHSTTLTCTVSSLENARLTIPRMGTPELVLGIQTQTTWDFTPSSFVVLE